METELVKVIQLKYPTISYVNKRYEGNKKNTVNSNFTFKTLKLVSKIKKIFLLQWATNLAWLGKLLQSYFVMIIRTLRFIKGYLSYKTKNFQNVSSEAQVKIFLSHGKVKFHSRY